VLAVVAMTDQTAVGFSTLSGVPCFRNHAAWRVDVAFNNNANKGSIKLLGILDDILQGESVDDDSEPNNFESNEQMIELYHSLIFASDLRREISSRMDECIESEFSEYLNTLMQSSQDEEERQGIMKLIDQINEVERMMAEKALIASQEKEGIESESQVAASEEPLTRSPKTMSNADVLRKANEIDAAIAMSDDEKPSDFISDCREVVNLSRGFNDSGQMRVGGG